MSVANAQEANAALETKQEQEREEQKEKVELYGKAQELFDARSRDTFTVERHGVEIEFLYPDPETKKEFEDQQKKVVEQAQDGADLFDLLQEAEVGLESMEQTLSNHAVDPSLQETGVWRNGLGFTDEEVGDLYRDFIGLGESESQSQTAEMLQTLLSEDS